MAKKKKETDDVIPSSAEIARIIYIDAQIASDTYPNIENLARGLNKGKATVHRDLEILKGKYIRAPIEYDPKKKGYYYTDKTFRVPALFATAEDLMAIQLVRELAGLYRYTPIYDTVCQLIEKLITPIGNANDQNLLNEGRIVIPKMFTMPVKKEIWQSIITGIRENKVIEIRYIAADKKATNKPGNKQRIGLTTRYVHPYQLIFNKNEWILYGYDVGLKQRKFYRLCRAMKVKIINQVAAFELPDDFDIRKEQPDNKKAKKRTYRFVIECYGDVRRLREQRLGSDKKYKETKNGTEFSFTSDDFNKILRWVIYMGATVRPLKPKLLVDKWKENIKEMAKLAKDS